MSADSLSLCTLFVLKLPTMMSDGLLHEHIFFSLAKVRTIVLVRYKRDFYFCVFSVISLVV